MERTILSSIEKAIPAPEVSSRASRVGSFMAAAIPRRTEVALKKLCTESPWVGMVVIP
jgi:hypothetical protein